MNQLTVTSSYEGLRAIGPWLAEVLEPLDEARRAPLQTRIELAVHELATNSVDHSNSPDDSFVLDASLDDEFVVVELHDRGDAVDVGSIPPPDLDEPQIRGYGMMIVEQLATRLDYARHHDRNIWTATFDIPHGAPASDNT